MRYQQQRLTRNPFRRFLFHQLDIAADTSTRAADENKNVESTGLVVRSADGDDRVSYSTFFEQYEWTSDAAQGSRGLQSLDYFQAFAAVSETTSNTRCATETRTQIDDSPTIPLLREQYSMAVENLHPG